MVFVTFCHEYRMYGIERFGEVQGNNENKLITDNITESMEQGDKCCSCRASGSECKLD